MKKDIFILGIESSCDETAAAVVANGRRICSSIVASSLEIHRNYGGVVPELASRASLEAIVEVMDAALKEADLSVDDIDGIAVTAGPGLIGSLLVGVSAAKALAAARNKPLIPVHHLAGHLAANYLAHPELSPPYTALLVSGAHSHLIEVRDYSDFLIHGRTRDDAPGEAFDKIARVIGLPYPGGPEIDEISKEGRADRLRLPEVHFKDSLDFSFSGLKTAVINQVHQAEQKARKAGVERESILSNADIAASFQEALCRTLVGHSLELIHETGAKTFALAGGVSANHRLRSLFEEAAEREGIRLFMPPLLLCTDNAAMIASQGYFDYMAGKRADMELNAHAVSEMSY